MPVPSPFPAFGPSVARGFRAAASPPVLGLAFLALLAVWGIYSAIEAPLSPRLLVNMMALPPVHLYFDIVLVASVAFSTVKAAALFLGVAAGRALLWAGISLLLARRIAPQGAPVPPVSLGRFARTAGLLFLLLSVESAVLLSFPLVIQTLGGAEFALLSVMAALIAGLHFLGFAPVLAAVEEEPAASMFRRSYRGGRLPGGGRHLLLVVAYFSFVFWSATITPTGDVAPATPSVVIWGFSLLATFVHVGVLGAFAYRWYAVRDQVSGVPAPRPARTR